MKNLPIIEYSPPIERPILDRFCYSDKPEHQYNCRYHSARRKVKDLIITYHHDYDFSAQGAHCLRLLGAEEFHKAEHAILLLTHWVFFIADQTQPSMIDAAQALRRYLPGGRPKECNPPNIAEYKKWAKDAYFCAEALFAKARDYVKERPETSAELALLGRSIAAYLRELKPLLHRYTEPESYGEWLRVFTELRRPTLCMFHVMEQCDSYMPDYANLARLAIKKFDTSPYLWNPPIFFNPVIADYATTQKFI